MRFLCLKEEYSSLYSVGNSSLNSPTTIQRNKFRFLALSAEKFSSWATQRNTTLLFIWFVTTMPLHCFSLSTAVPGPHLGFAQVSPVTFTKFGARFNKRKMLHQSHCGCRKRRWRRRGEGEGVGGNWEINQWKLCQHSFPGWDDGKTFSYSLGDIICEHTASSRAWSFRA